MPWLFFAAPTALAVAALSAPLAHGRPPCQAEGARALQRPWASLATLPECCTQAARRSWVAQWRYAGWSTASEERVSAEERGRFHKDWRSSAGLLTTGSDSDVEIYRKFGLPTHPAIDRASIWLGLLTGTSLPAARDALEVRPGRNKSGKKRVKV